MSSSCENTNSTPIKRKAKAWLLIAGVVAVGLVSGVGAFVGAKFASVAETPLSPLELHAATASHNEALSMATGLITSEVEGLWLLDHETGQLQCWVLSPRNGAVAGIFGTNVAKDLDASKGKPKLLMTTGNFFFSGGRAGNQTPGRSICYVANTTSGVVAGYSVSVNAQAISRGQTQAGEITKVCTGKIGQQAATRDQ